MGVVILGTGMGAGVGRAGVVRGVLRVAYYVLRET